MTTATSTSRRSMLPRRRLSASGTVVGVDIGTHSIKIVQVESGGGAIRPRVCRVVAHANPPASTSSDLWLAEIEHTLSRAWSSRNRWWPLPAACTLSMKLMAFRTFEVQESEDESATSQDLQTAFQEEPDTAVGPWISEAWSTQLDVSSQGHRNYAVLGVEESFAEKLAAVLWRCGLDCRVLDGLPFAMARAASTASVPEPVAVIDWGDSTMTLTVVVDGQPFYTRLLRDCELRSLATAMMRPLDLEAEQCRQLLTAYGFCRTESSTEANDMSTVLAEISAPYLNHVTEELRRTWAFLQQLPGQMPKSVVLMGGGATLKMSAAMIRSVIPAPVKVWTLPSTSGKEADTDTNSAAYGTAFALAGLLKAR